MPENYFDERIASIYDSDAADMFRPEVLDAPQSISWRSSLATETPSNSPSEPAAWRSRSSVGVSGPLGIDLSPQMVAQLQQKPGAKGIEVVVGDMTSTRVPGSFGLVYVLFNSIGNLLTQAEQTACFHNAASHLEPGGFFVIEQGVPNLERLSPRRRVEAFTVSTTRLGFDEVTDFVSQRAVSHHYRISGDTVNAFSTPWRWVWPSELDLMAQLAGMALHERWSSWTRGPFSEDSTTHVSVWQLPK